MIDHDLVSLYILRSTVERARVIFGYKVPKEHNRFHTVVSSVRFVCRIHLWREHRYEENSRVYSVEMCRIISLI